MSDPRVQLETVIQAAIDLNLKSLHTMLPGVVESFDGITQLADIQPTIKTKLQGESINLPLLTGVPVRFQGSDDFFITNPIKEGSHVLLIFAERSIDTWLTYGGIQDPNDTRRHTLSDAFAIPFMYDQTNVIANFNNDNLEIRGPNGLVISVNGSGLITIKNNSENLKTLLDDLITETKAITTFGSPTFHQVSSGSQALLEAVKTRIATLLE